MQIISGALGHTCRAGSVSVLIAPILWASVLISSPAEGAPFSVNFKYGQRGRGETCGDTGLVSKVSGRPGAGLGLRLQLKAPTGWLAGEVG